MMDLSFKFDEPKSLKISCWLATRSGNADQRVFYRQGYVCGVGHIACYTYLVM
jgi:hypothetical protein